MLIHTTHALEGTHIERILRSQIARMRCLDLTARNIIMLFPLQGGYLSLCQDNAFTGYLGLQILEAILKAGQVMAQPDAADTAGRDEGTEYRVCEARYWFASDRGQENQRHS